MPALRILSQNLRELRRLRKLTQEQVAERAGVTYRHYQEIEASGRPGLQVVTVERLAKAFDLETWELLNPHLARSRRHAERNT